VSQQDSEESRVLSLVHGQVCYLQIPAADTTESAAFYEAVFGWRIERPYTDFEAPGLIGQWVDDRAPSRYGGPMIWLHVTDMDETLERAVAHGAEITDSPSPDGPDRTLAAILDPAGNPIGLAAHAKPE
jgi:uncharacterized protein